MKPNLSPANLVRGVIVVISVALIVLALTRIFSVPTDVAELEVVVENANLRLRNDEYAVQVFDGVDGTLVAEGGAGNGELPTLKPGEYNLRVIVQGVWPPQASSRDLTMPGGRRTRVDFDYSYGELELEADAPSDDTELVKVQVFAEAQDEVPVIGFVAGESVKLAAGQYNLRVVRTVDTNEKQVRWIRGITIEPGRQRHIAVAFERGLLRVDATNAGEEIAAADGTVTVFAAGDDSHRIVESGPLNVPIPLPTGVYDLLVTYDASNDRPVREARSVAIVDGEMLSVPIEFNSGGLIVRALTAAGEPLAEYDAYTYVYRRSDHRSAVAYVPAGQRLRLSAGQYDVRASLFRSADRPEVWLRGIDVVANETLELQTTFDVGNVVVRVMDERGREHTGDEYTITVHPPKDRTRVLHRMQAGTPTRISTGRVQLRIQNTYTGTSEWRTAEILSGETTEIVMYATAVEMPETDPGTGRRQDR